MEQRERGCLLHSESAATSTTPMNSLLAKLFWGIWRQLANSCCELGEMLVDGVILVLAKWAKVLFSHSSLVLIEANNTYQTHC